MKKILFLIHDLGQGGAEKVLINLVNNMNRKKFDISVIALFGGGINEQFLKSDIKFKVIFPKNIPGNSHIMKFFSPEFLHKIFIKEVYDIEVSYLEGPCARIISGCDNKDTKLVSWIHCTMNSQKEIASSFRNIKEAESCYNAMNKMIFVSKGVCEAFLKNFNYEGKSEVLYNTVESDKILQMSAVKIEKIKKDKIRLIAVGTLKPVKGFDRLVRIVKRLHEDQYPIHLYILGRGPQQSELEKFIKENKLEEVISLLGYKTNPYSFISKSSLFICSSLSEGFSTAVTESLIVGTPVCTVDVSGMKELLGDNNEYGIVTKNSEECLYQAIKELLDNSELLLDYKKRAEKRGKDFSKEKTVCAVEKMLEKL